MSLLESETHIGNSLTAEVHSEPHQISKLEPFCEKCVRMRSYSGPHFSQLCQIRTEQGMPNAGKCGKNADHKKLTHFN